MRAVFATLVSLGLFFCVSSSAQAGRASLVEWALLRVGVLPEWISHALRKTTGLDLKIAKAMHPRDLADLRRRALVRRTVPDIDELTSDLRIIESTLQPFASSLPEAALAAKPTFKFSLLDGKLKIGELRGFEHLVIEGGEINTYRWLAAGGGLSYCKIQSCYDDLLKVVLDDTIKLKELREAYDAVQKSGAKEGITKTGPSNTGPTRAEHFRTGQGSR
jgi:hypothetical protein